MNFYYNFFATALIFTLFEKSGTNTNTELRYTESGLLALSQTSIGLVFFVKINNTSDRNDYDIEITPDECCLEDDDKVDCDSLRIIGGCLDYVPKGKTKTFQLIAPILSQYERKGNCALYVDSKLNNGQNERDTIKIYFDTSYNNKIEFIDNFRHCEHKDEDPFNECRPVNCDTYYNGNKPHFSRKLKRCVTVPPCIKDEEYDYPSVIYNPQSNLCLEESILNEDLEYIKALRKDKGKIRKSKEVIIINKFDPNTTAFMNDVLIDDIAATTTTEKRIKIKTDKLRILKDMPENKPYDCFSEDANFLTVFLKKYFVDSKWTLLILVLVIIVQCLMICTMIYCLSKACVCCKEKKVVRKFFNYRQDVSVTTPLINTSNVDTETIDYQYVTESSNNIDQKIKCYKACQKENNNVKKSMSDDILSKLLNRRDWKKFKSPPKPDIEETMKHIPQNNQVNNLPKDEKGPMPSETKVVFEDEKTNNIIFKKHTLVNSGDALNDRTDIQGLQTNVSSEKEIKCHSYNRFDTDFAEYRTDLAMNTGIFEDAKPIKGTNNSSEKGAQAYFSNDSIDDFLSERGVIYLAGENMSKYTFSSDSNNMKPSLTSSGSSRTSKNFVKHVFSLLRKRSKQGPSSDPGQNKDIDLELIHMSRASVYSSTNDSECMKNLKRKDSRTSF